MKYVSFEPAAFLEGVLELSPEERGFYITLIALNYARAKENGHGWEAGDVTDRLISDAMDCDPRIWRRVKRRLKEKGKVVEIEGKLYANRVREEVKRIGKRIQQLNGNGSESGPTRGLVAVRVDGHFVENQGLIATEGKVRKKNSSKGNSSFCREGAQASSLPLDARARSPASASNGQPSRPSKQEAVAMVAILNKPEDKRTADEIGLVRKWGIIQ